MAREIAAATGCNLNAPHFSDIKVVIPDRLSVQVQAAADCPRYVGRVLKQVKADAVTPVWMQERLRRSGIHCLSPIVDVMNYVMLELGQPMHAFDLQKITGSIQVRFAQPSESLQLLDGQTIDLVPETLLIADEEKPLAIAGIMGGLVSGVTPLTQDIFIESAFFKAKTIARTRQHYHFSSESSYRFERGIDPALQVKAIERATELLLKITDGQPGPIIETASPAYLPQSAPIELRESQLEKILGFKIASMDIEMILKRLNFSVDKTSLGWRVLVPAVRSDISLEVDLIEEVMRLYGYEKLPANQAAATLKISQHTLDTLDLAGLRQLFCHMGYHEVITYSFVNKKTQYWLDQQSVPKELVNPITEDMTVMRTNLWPGLMNALLYNQNRQQLRVRLFEIGLRFLPQGGHLLQQKVLGGLINGPAFPEQWGVPTRTVDYFDLKGDLEKALELLTGSAGGFQFKPALHSALHPKQTAEIEYQGQNVGILGALDPRVAHELDVSEGVFLFELWLDRFPALSIPLAVNISKFPEIRRDIAIFVDQTVPVQYIQDTIKDVSGGLLREINIFDVYEGQGVPLHRKSIAVALTLQHPSRTLMEEEVAGIIYKIISALEQEFAAELRG
jgi:phenylalanyl-tRNA synthetase beta chain